MSDHRCYVEFTDAEPPVATTRRDEAFNQAVAGALNHESINTLNQLLDQLDMPNGTCFRR